MSVCFSAVETEEDIHLADEEVQAALDREDELGELVSAAFSFSVPPFRDVRDDPAPRLGEGGDD